MIQYERIPNIPQVLQNLDESFLNNSLVYIGTDNKVLLKKN